jgi:hypothetical protein
MAMNQDDVWPEFWPNKSRMTQKEFLSIINRIEQVPHIVNYDDTKKLIELIKILVVELGFLERVVEEYERDEVRF